MAPRTPRLSPLARDRHAPLEASVQGVARDLGFLERVRRTARGELVVLLAVLALGLMHLPQPFERDQATFTLGAQRLAAGGVLYRDFWDVKQPGIYAFYLVAGRLFGFTETGVHLLELLWMMALAVTLLVTLRRRWGPGPAATLAPLLTVGPYYAAVGSWHLTQVEGLVGLPLYLALWFATPAADGELRAWRAFLSGLCGAVVLLFKLAFLPLVAAIWLVALADALRRPRGGPARALLSVALPVALGLALPWAAVLADLARHGLLGTLRWTYLAYPALVASQVHGTRVDTLFRGLQWFLLRWAPLLGLAVAGAALVRRDRLALGLGLWVALGFAVILAQRASWWEYHYVLFCVPLGVLGAAGIGALWAGLDRLGAGAPGARRAVAASLVALFAGFLGLAGMKAVLLARERFALRPADLASYQQRMSGLYYRTAQDVALLAEPGRLPGAVFVLDNPLVYLRSGRAASTAFKGVYFPEVMGEAEWSVLTSRLERDPPAYILVEPEYLPIVQSGEARVQRFAGFLAARYREARRIGPDVWYERAR